MSDLVERLHLARHISFFVSVTMLLASNTSFGQTPSSSDNCGRAVVEIRAEVRRLQADIDHTPVSINRIRHGVENLTKMIQKEKQCASSSRTILTPGTVDTKLTPPATRPPPGEMWNRINRTHQSVPTPTAQGSRPNNSGLELNRVEEAINLLRAELQKPALDVNKLRLIVSSIGAHN